MRVHSRNQSLLTGPKRLILVKFDQVLVSHCRLFLQLGLHFTTAAAIATVTRVCLVIKVTLATVTTVFLVTMILQETLATRLILVVLLEFRGLVLELNTLLQHKETPGRAQQP